MADNIHNPKFASFASADSIYLDAKEVDIVLRSGPDATFLFSYMIRYSKTLTDMAQEDTRKYLFGAKKPWPPRRYRAALEGMVDAFIEDRFSEFTLFDGFSIAASEKKLKALGWPERGKEFYQSISRKNKAEFEELQRTIREETSLDGGIYGFRG